MQFTHFHVHSQYSILDGAASIPGLIEKAKADGQTALALTDHGNIRHVEQHLQQVGKRQRQTDQKDLFGQRAFRQRIRLRTHTFFLYPIHPNRTRAHRGTASIIRHCAAFARWIR